MDPNLPTGETMSEGTGIVESGETAEIPASLVDSYPNVGDVISLRVTATDPESGVITVGKVEGAPEPAGGSEEMASEFDSPPTPQSL